MQEHLYTHTPIQVQLQGGLASLEQRGLQFGSSVIGAPWHVAAAGHFGTKRAAQPPAAPGKNPPPGIDAWRLDAGKDVSDVELLSVPGRLRISGTDFLAGYPEIGYLARDLVA